MPLIPTNSPPEIIRLNNDQPAHSWDIPAKRWSDFTAQGGDTYCQLEKAQDNASKYTFTFKPSCIFNVSAYLRMINDTQTLGLSEDEIQLIAQNLSTDDSETNVYNVANCGQGDVCIGPNGHSTFGKVTEDGPSLSLKRGLRSEVYLKLPDGREILLGKTDQVVNDLSQFATLDVNNPSYLQLQPATVEPIVLPEFVSEDTIMNDLEAWFEENKKYGKSLLMLGALFYSLLQANKLRLRLRENDGYQKFIQSLSKSISKIQKIYSPVNHYTTDIDGLDSVETIEDIKLYISPHTRSQLLKETLSFQKQLETLIKSNSEIHPRAIISVLRQSERKGREGIKSKRIQELFDRILFRNVLGDEIPVSISVEKLAEWLIYLDRLKMELERSI